MQKKAFVEYMVRSSKGFIFFDPMWGTMIGFGGQDGKITQVIPYFFSEGMTLEQLEAERIKNQSINIIN